MLRHRDQFGTKVVFELAVNGIAGVPASGKGKRPLKAYLSWRRGAHSGLTRKAPVEPTRSVAWQGGETIFVPATMYHPKTTGSLRILATDGFLDKFCTIVLVLEQPGLIMKKAVKIASAEINLAFLAFAQRPEAYAIPLSRTAPPSTAADDEPIILSITASCRWTRDKKPAERGPLGPLASWRDWDADPPQQEAPSEQRDSDSKSRSSGSLLAPDIVVDATSDVGSDATESVPLHPGTHLAPTLSRSDRTTSAGGSSRRSVIISAELPSAIIKAADALNSLEAQALLQKLLAMPTKKFAAIAALHAHTAIGDEDELVDSLRRIQDCDIGVLWSDDAPGFVIPDRGGLMDATGFQLGMVQAAA